MDLFSVPGPVQSSWTCSVFVTRGCSAGQIGHVKNREQAALLSMKAIETKLVCEAHAADKDRLVLFVVFPFLQNVILGDSSKI